MISWNKFCNVGSGCIAFLLLGCQPIIDPVSLVSPTSSPLIEGGYPSLDYPESIMQIMNDVAAKCKSNIEFIETGSASVICGNIFNIFYPPEPGPSETTLVPVAHFLYRNARWLIGSETEIEVPGENTPQPLEFLKNALLTPGLQFLMSKSSYLISVGTASSEGDFDIEVLRAEERSINIDGILRITLPKSNVLKEFYRLNLGKYENTCIKKGTASTAHQRPVLVMNILIEKEGKILPSGLAVPGLGENEIQTLLQEKVRRTSAGDIDFSCYPIFDLEI